MKDVTKELLDILKRIDAGIASEEDLRRYNQWCDEQQDRERGNSTAGWDTFQKDRLLETIAGKTFEKKRSMINLRTVATLAASLLCVIAAALWIGQRNNTIRDNNLVMTPMKIPSAQEGTVLIMGNGDQIDLEKQKQGLIGGGKDSEISKSNDSSLVYSNRLNTASNGPVFNTLLTARGHQYQLTLADGTKVWLNASSSLRFPVNFMGQKQRKVILEGEAYFEVAKNPEVPFVVVTDKQEIKVLGTHFNVKSDQNASSSATTLLEGSVMVNNSVKLVPGEQLVASGSGLSKRRVNVEDVIAWKNGFFNFEGKQIPEIMDELARWYDFEVRYVGAVPKDKVDATISRKKRVDEVLDLLEMTGLAKFSKSGNTIVVTQTK
ncbi:FecR domain-containing protein [Sphingobacterium sp.]|uniref:FecR family protein n=1 Tax=Sphingobacterium sp. TaxID=341027 RepID=UPI00258D0532|nr:FecR domain-containing protein [Sphingobacterium sp.]WET68670.1 MAG: FecR domain-containing protein [Sphingobacterium sp.]